MNEGSRFLGIESNAVLLALFCLGIFCHLDKVFPMPSGNNPGPRWAIAIILVMITLAVFFFLFLPLTQIDVQKLKLGSIPFNDITKTSLQVRIDQSRSLFQLGLLVTAGLWALIVAKKDEVKIELSDPEAIMLVCANVVLVLFYWLNIGYLGSVAYASHLGGAIVSKDTPKDAILPFPDIFDSPVNSQFDDQYKFLLIGIGFAVVTLVSAHKVK